MRPHVGLVRRDVEIAEEQRRDAGLGLRIHQAEFLHEVELVAELRIDLRVRLVAAGRDVEIVDADAPVADGQPRRQVPGVADGAEILAENVLEGPLRDGGDAVIALLAMQGDVLVAERAERLFRELVVGALGLLQAEDVGRLLLKEALDERDAQAHGIDVPGGDRKRHRGSLSAGRTSRPD